ncbi:GFA family protein [Colwellia sp. E2M01]|uniref:GFA family protein n=1 Tax=Colwellia sp. E2M01 TaxID=2841561 RepID=UPI001C093E59|nr:GFA family protein [Colwellia sp. E2M01]MBU2871936.1 GFA family protein [Colwellia sp. E2M01]
MSFPIKFPIMGACQCGQLTYQLFEKPKMVLACHCTECQKLAGSPFSVTAVIDTAAIKFSGEMKEWIRSADSGNKNHAKFCPNCGTRIYHYNPADMSTVKLKLKPIMPEVAELFAPQVHVWVSEKLSWYKIPDDMKCIDKQP